MTVNRSTCFIAGAVVTVAGLTASFFVLKALGDLLFPEIPGFSLEHAVLFILATVLVAAFLFVEAYRLFKAAAHSKQTR